MNKIKVLQLGSSIGLYGAERWILALVNNIGACEIEVIVGSICDDYQSEPALCREAALLGFKTCVFTGINRLDLSVVSSLRKYIQESDISVLHTHGYKTDFLGLLATRGIECKLITTPHGWTNNPDYKLRIYEIIDRCILPFFDAVAPLSDELFRSLQHIPGLKRKLHLIPNGVDTEEIENEENISTEISAWKADGAFVIGYIGRLTSGKGLDILFDAVANHAKPHWRIAIVGEGEQESELKIRTQKLSINNTVEFFGFRPDRLSFLKGFDVFVLPSRSEGIPRCLMEAMVAGVPIVASDIPGCCYLVKDGETGLLFPVDDANSLADAIKKVERSATFRDKLSMAAKEFVYSQYSAAKMAKEYTKLYNILVYR